MEKGFIKLFRSFLRWEWYNDLPVFKVFIHLLLTVNWEEKKWHGIVVERGATITSVTHLSKQTRLTYKQVRTALNKLKSTGEIEVETTNKYSKIKINNYDNYQKYEILMDTQGARYKADNNSDIEEVGQSRGTHLGTQTGSQTTNNKAHYNTDKYYTTEEVGQTKGAQMGSQVGSKRATTKEYKEYKNKRNIYTPKKKRPKIESHIYDFEELERNLARANKK